MASRRTVQWSTSTPSHFLVNSASELRLCEYSYGSSSSGTATTSGTGSNTNNRYPATSGDGKKYRVKTLAVCSDLPAFKSLAWSPDPQTDDLVAVGLSTGRTILLRIHETPVYTSNPSPTILQLNVRHPRPCNVVAFSPNDYNLVLTGYDKVRDNSLLVWDIRNSFTSSQSATAQSMVSRRSSVDDAGSYYSAGTSSTKTRATAAAAAAAAANGTAQSAPPDFRPIAQYGLSEQVTAATFLHSSKLLVAAMAGKWIRCYDIRAPSSNTTPTAATASANTNASAVMNGRNVTSLIADPFDSHRFSSISDDGLVRLWDLRHNQEPLLTFSSEDGIHKASFSSINSEASSNGSRKLPRNASKISLTTSNLSAAANASPANATGSVVSMAFSTTRRGHLATLDRDSNYLSAWNIFEFGEKNDGLPMTPGTSLMLNAPSQDDSKQAPIPTLYYERRTESLSRSLTSFAFVPGSGGAQQFVTVNKDGHVEFCQVDESPQLAFASTGQFAWSHENGFSVEGSKLAPPTAVLPVQPTHRPSVVSMAKTAIPSRIYNLASGQTTPVRSRSLNKRTTKGGAGGSRRRKQAEGTDDGTKTARATSDEELQEQSRLPLLEKDISVVMRDRAEKGYGLDPSRNKRLIKESALELWSWIDHAATLSANGRAYVDSFDFGFKGVLAILKGFPPQEPLNGPNNPSESSARASTQSRRSRTTSHASNSNIIEDVKSSLRKGDINRAQDLAFTKAATILNKRNGSTPFTISSKPAQRQLALSSIGADFASGDVAAVIKRYESLKQPSKAAAWALFNGNIELAVNSLKRNEDERLKLLAPILATYLSQRDQAGNTSFKELCAGLSTDLDDPFLRAIFAYLASGEWSDVLDEEALPLRDRVGVALRFLPDDELHRTLESMAKKATAVGDLEGILLTGLDAAGLTLLQSYVDRTGDVQTAALAAAFVHPGQLNDPRAERWIESYRKLLDHWKLYSIRARFDIARGSKMRSSLLVKGIDETSAAIGAMIAPPQMLIRCHFCNETISPKKQETQPVPAGKRRQTPTTTVARSRTTRCPNCSKSFPRCAICLESIEVSTTGKDATPAWCWCQHCRHGGHAAHFLEWFRRGNTECPVADCDCHCRGD